MNLNSLASAFPPHAYSQADCLEAIQRSPVVRTLRSRSLKLLERILAADSGIDRRHFYLPEPAEIFSRDAQTLNQLFEIQAPLHGRVPRERDHRILVAGHHDRYHEMGRRVLAAGHHDLHHGKGQ